MKIKRHNILLIIISLIYSSCIDEYWPDMTKYDNLLVVEGILSNGEPPYTIKLSFSSDVDAAQKIPFKNCEVSIKDEFNNEETLIEELPGIYKTQGDEFKGQAGIQYKLLIKTPEGKKYESRFETLPTPVEIDTIYKILEYRESPEENHDLVGYQFYIDTKTAARDSAYFWWDLQETYEYSADFTIEYVYYGSVQPFPNWDTLFTCWKTSEIKEIYITSTEDLTGTEVTGFPLIYIDTETRKLSKRYSLLVNQYTISAEVYNYWDDIKDQITEGGSLFSTQPFQIRGNIVNTNDPEEPVLGYFITAGLSQKRLFANPPYGAMFYYSTCNPIFEMNLGFSRPWQWPIYITLIDGKFATAGEGCFDCTSKGGSTDMPDFWCYD